ncbi:histidine phosphatase family protein [Klebsiella oxytoca]|uniref:histidine phosphatase family protein n=1 Tax=Klebsiella oxytoca TaxID=571 RepID=UPI00384A9B97
MELFLLRHGKPDIDSSTAVRSVDMSSWIAEYDEAGVSGAPDAAIAAVCNNQFIVCSPVRRALESVSILGIEADVIIDELHEVPLPVFNIPLLELRPSLWAALFRLFWMLGGSRGVETFSSAKMRAKFVSCELDKMAEVHGRVLSVGHGFMNTLIAIELKKAGWKKLKSDSSGYWSCIKLVR